MFRSKCLVCKSNKSKKIIDLGMHPYADTFISKGFLSSPEPVYPLECNLCQECGQIQTSCITDPKSRYSARDYSYTSANSSYSKRHWQQFAKGVAWDVSLKKDSLIVEVGSNDGYMLSQLNNLGFENTIGIDASPIISQCAMDSYGVKTITGLFEDVAQDPSWDFKSKCDLIVANNVLNHSNDPLGMVNLIAEMLTDDGYFVCEVPYWVSLLDTKKFDQIYHEHVSYFTATSSYNLLKQAGLAIIKVEIVDYHGGSLRIFAKKGNTDNIIDQLRCLMNKEDECEVFNISTYISYMDSIVRQRNEFMKRIYEIKSKGFPIVGVGAAAKGNTFLNYYNLDNTLLECVTDSSPHKKDKYTPLTRIYIQGDEILKQHDEVYVIILSWNLAHKLKPALKRINPQINFLTASGEIESE